MLKYGRKLASFLHTAILKDRGQFDIHCVSAQRNRIQTPSVREDILWTYRAV